MGARALLPASIARVMDPSSPHYAIGTQGGKGGMWVTAASRASGAPNMRLDSNKSRSTNFGLNLAPGGSRRNYEDASPDIQVDATKSRPCVGVPTSVHREL